MYTLPQEIEVWYIIPAIRKELASCLIRNYSITYEKVGEMMGITKAAVSQYLSNKRAAKIKIHENALKEVCKSCELIVAKKKTTSQEILRVLEFIRNKNLPCEVCDKSTQGVLGDCEEIKLKNINII